MTPLINFNINKATDYEVREELALLIAEKRKLRKQIDSLDTEIIGLKEEIRRREDSRPPPVVDYYDPDEEA